MGESQDRWNHYHKFMSIRSGAVHSAGQRQSEVYIPHLQTSLLSIAHISGQRSSRPNEKSNHIGDRRGEPATRL